MNRKRLNPCDDCSICSKCMSALLEVIDEDKEEAILEERSRIRKELLDFAREGLGGYASEVVIEEIDRIFSESKEENEK